MGEDETGDAQVNMNVTMRSDDEVELARQRATAAGLTGVVLVDDQQPPPPGTVASASLGRCRTRPWPKRAPPASWGPGNDHREAVEGPRRPDAGRHRRAFVAAGR
jgi:hypothetical protein